jgi:N-acetyl-gamma-glutamyl-phosphate reductase
MKVGVVGASGYTGGELLRILSGHPECEVVCATSRSLAGKNITHAHPNLRGFLDLKFEDLSGPEVASRCDFIFTAMPHGASMKIVPQLLVNGAKVVDLSGDFRFRDVLLYEKYYKVHHEHPEVKAVYGLPELHREEIAGAELVANPGCYPVGAILGLAPIVGESLVINDRIVVDSKSGISGAGAKPGQKTHFATTAESVLAYNASSHRHLPEIEQELKALAGDVKISFVPHLVPVVRGISTTIHMFLKKDVAGEDIQKLYANFYAKEPFVRVLGAGEVPHLGGVRGSNYIDIGCFEVDSERWRCVITTVIDNLIKGAAGNAVQNMNIMMGYEETMGIHEAGVYP